MDIVSPPPHSPPSLSLHSSTPSFLTQPWLGTSPGHGRNPALSLHLTSEHQIQQSQLDHSRVVNLATKYNDYKQLTCRLTTM